MTLQRRSAARRDRRPKVDTSMLAHPKPGDKAKHMALQARAFNERREPSAKVRREVFARDNGICALCGIDTEQLANAWAEALKADFRQYTCNICDRETTSVPCVHCNAVTCSRSHVHREAFRDQLEQLGFPPAIARKYSGTSLWQADHVVPVEEGGVDLGIENFRTLCLKCHDEVTRLQAETRALRRRHAR